MDCVTAGPFVSLIYDGISVPDEAARHVAGCSSCQGDLRGWAEGAARLRIAAAVDRLAPLPPLVFEDRAPVRAASRPFWRSWMSPMRIPRALAAAATVILVVSWAGWYRAETASRVIDELHFQTTFTCPFGPAGAGGSVKNTGAGVQLVGSRTSFFTSSACHGSGRGGLVGVVDPVRVRDGILTLRLGVAVVETRPAMPSPPLQIDPALLREYQFVTGQSIEIPVPGGPPLTFTGRVVQRAARSPAPSTIDALLPKPGELVITMPALIRDGRDVVVTINAGVTSSAGSITKLYAPGAGLFLFGLDRFEGATPAVAGGAALSFEANGHKYTLYSTLPMTAGEQPRSVWVRHISDYRPSQHGAAAGADDLPALGNITDVGSVLPGKKQ